MKIFDLEIVDHIGVFFKKVKDDAKCAATSVNSRDHILNVPLVECFCVAIGKKLLS